MPANQRVSSICLSAKKPMFQLFDDFPGIQMSHEVTDVFRGHVEYSEEFKDRLAEGVKSPGKGDRRLW